MTAEQFLALVTRYDHWIYALLFGYAIAKTGPLPMIAGFVSAIGALEVTAVIVTVMTGTLLGGHLRYAVGRWASPWLYETFPKIGLWLALGAAAVDRYQRALLPLYRFSKGTFTMVGLGAGAAMRDWRRFALLDGLGGVLWTLTSVGIGFGIGLAGATIDPRWAAYFGLGLLALGILGAIVFGSQLRRLLLPHANEALAKAMQRRRTAHAQAGSIT